MLSKAMLEAAPKSSPVSSQDLLVSFPDGTGYTRDQIMAGINPTDIPRLVEGKLNTTDPDVLQTLCDLPFQQGDCPVDSLMGVYWLCKNRELLAWSAPGELKDDRPVIAVGSGPSLTAAIPKLREIQSAYRIVCAHSTLEALLDAGVMPDAYCPTERVDPSLVNHRNYQLDSVVYAGLPYVPYEHQRCRLKMSVCGYDPPFEWADARHPRVNYGSSSGTLAVGVACELTTGPIYLVGHDLCGGHHQSHRFQEMADWDALRVPCVDGEQRPCSSLWYRCIQQMGDIAKGHNVIQTSTTGAVIKNTTTGRLPDHDGIKKAPLTPVMDSLERISAIGAKVARLPHELEAARQRAVDAETIDQIALGRLFGAENRHVWAGVFLSLYFQLSLEKRFGREHLALPWFKEAFANMEDHLCKTVKELL